MEQPHRSSSAPAPKRLGSLLELGLAAERPWRPEELGAILEHNLAAPLEFDLAVLRPAHARQLHDLAAQQRLLLRSLRELFDHPLPPLELLLMTKEFAKSCRQAPDSPLPKAVASVIYHLCIAAALTRLGEKISTLSDPDLEQAMAWVLDQPWVDEDCKSLVREARARLTSSTG